MDTNTCRPPPRRATLRCASPLALALLLAVASVAQAQSTGAGPVALDALIAEALTRNPDIRAARLEHEAALQRRAPAQALDDPMLEVGVVNASLPLNLRRDDMTMQMLGLSQKLPFPGKRRLREAVAGADADVIAHAVEETTNRVVRDLRLAYADLELAERSAEIVGHTQDTLRTLASVAASRYAVGRTSQADVLQAGTRTGQVQQELLRIRTERRSAESELRRLAGRAAADDPIVPVIAGRRGAAADPAGGDGSDRPQLAALRAMEVRGELELALAEREYYPDVELRLGYGHRERTLDGLPRDDVVTMTFAVNLPIWRKDRLAPRVAEARALRARAGAMAEGQRLETRAGIETQSARLAEARDSLALYRSTLLPQARAATDAARAGWEHAGGDFNSVLDATMREYEVTLAEAAASTAWDRAQAEIDFLIGHAPKAAAATGELP